MFYPVESLKRGGRFYLCWVADSWPLRFATITHRQLWSQDIRRICDDLLEVMTNESGRPTRRFSLRLSSQLMRGLVRLYQRKVTVFLGDLCMINANVIKLVNKKFVIQKRVAVEARPRLSRLVLQHPENEERLEEMIQQSGNTVANVQDITLKDATLPEYQPMLNDNFGELNADLPADKTIEMMLGQDVSVAHHSALEPPLERSADTSAGARSHHPHMEPVSDLDATMFRTSMGRDALGVDIEKEIPEIPEIPEILPPDLSALPTDMQMAEKEKEIPVQQEQIKDVVEVSKEKEPSEIVLEELEDIEPQAKRRRLRGKIDKRTMLTSNYLRSRIGNIAVELRCEDSSEDVIAIRVPAEVLMGRPAHATHAGHAARSNLGCALVRLFTSNLAVVDKPPLAHTEMEEAIASRHTRSHIRTLEKIVEEVEPIPQYTDAQMQMEQDAVLSKEGAFDVTVPRVSGQEVDIADLPTQVLETLSQARKRTCEYAASPKRLRRSGYVSFKESQEMIVDIIPPYEADKENIRHNIQPEHDQTVDTGRDVTSMLQQAGLADLPMQKYVEAEKLPSPTNIQIVGCQKIRKNGSDRSETPLGSLDRTKVSLGDSDKTTDSKRFIRDQWGTEGTMIKILNCIKEGVTPLDVTSIIAKGPLIAGYKSIIAARCFTSILKLKQHSFINIYKDPNTLNIVDITLGPKFD